jgi:hypothetical protein
MTTSRRTSVPSPLGSGTPPRAALERMNTPAARVLLRDLGHETEAPR